MSTYYQSMVESDKRKEELNQKYMKAARGLYGHNGDIKLHEDEVVSVNCEGSKGAYVKAWVWVPEERTE